LGLEELLAAPDQTIHSFSSKQSLAAEPARWLLRKAGFRQDGVPHTLLLLDDVRLPLQAEEQTAWKRLVRVLGHEISNSLTPIKSIAGSLLMRVNQPGADETMLRDLRRGLGVIESRADALNRFAQSYRSLAQLPAPRLGPVPLGPLLERVVLLEQRLEAQLDPGPAVVLNADADQLEQMFINLLANAADASLAVGSRVVHLSWRLEDSTALVAIEDCGLGIANSENLFVPFYTTKPEGSGVGLALAQQIARAHGGEVTLVNREDGQGAPPSACLWRNHRASICPELQPCRAVSLYGKRRNTPKHFSFRYRAWVPHPRRVFVFAARVGFLYTIRRKVLGF
jgi:signal transduction histidine kinase